MAETILIITEDESLLDDLLRLCAAAGVEAEVAFSVTSSKAGFALSEYVSAPAAASDLTHTDGVRGGAGWASAPLVLVGEDRAARLRGVPRRPGVLLIGRDLKDPGVWEHGVSIGAEQVLSLPDDEPRLAEWIADAAEGTGSPAFTVGVLGGRGGAGASTLSCALALAAVRRGEHTTLIDADQLGGGLDVLMGGEAVEGLRWPALADSHGRVGGAVLAQSLPRLRGVSVLSWDRDGHALVTTEAMRSVLGAARRSGGVVVVDLPRRVDAAVAEALGQLDIGLLVVPAELPAVAAARRVTSGVKTVLRDLRVVTRGRADPGLGDTEIAHLLGLPLAGEMPIEYGLSRAVDGGQPPGADGRGPLARFCAAFWDQALRHAARPVPPRRTPGRASPADRDVYAMGSHGRPS